ncbi:hypothetical protein V8C43DRAFT_168682 [Trichoderma afarasin]
MSPKCNHNSTMLNLFLYLVASAVIFSCELAVDHGGGIVPFGRMIPFSVGKAKAAAENLHIPYFRCFPFSSSLW